MDQINCFSTLGCPQLSLRQSLELAKRRGFGMVEVRTVSGSNELPRMLADEFGTPAALGKHLAVAGISVPVIGTSHRLLGAPFDLQELHTLATWADAAGTKFLRVFDGDSGTLSDDMLDEIAARLARWDDLRATFGLQVRLIIETHGVLCSDDALAAFCARFPEVLILWDTHHTWAAGNALAHTLDIVGPRLAHLHVKDSRMIDGKRSYVLPGEGDFPMPSLVALLPDLSRSGIAMSLEWEALWHPELPAIESAFDSVRRWV